MIKKECEDTIAAWVLKGQVQLQIASVWIDPSPDSSRIQDSTV
jgi:hypothetical protein